MENIDQTQKNVWKPLDESKSLLYSGLCKKKYYFLACLHLHFVLFAVNLQIVTHSGRISDAFAVIDQQIIFQSMRFRYVNNYKEGTH